MVVGGSAPFAAGCDAADADDDAIDGASGADAMDARRVDCCWWPLNGGHPRCFGTRGLWHAVDSAAGDRGSRDDDAFRCQGRC